MAKMRLFTAIRSILTKTVLPKFFLSEFAVERVFIGNTINHQSAFIRRSLFARFGSYDEKFPIFADVEKWLVYKENGCRFKHLPVIVAGFYRTGVSSRYTESYYAERHRMYENILTPIF